MNGTLTFHGSHGTLTACAVSGHIIDATPCDCDDCARLGDYGTLGLVDVTALDPRVIASGGGDILQAPIISPRGSWWPAMQWVQGAKDDYWQELALLPAPGAVQ